MPAIKLQHVVSSSSEDTTHKADNLLKPETYRKWKCAEDADRKASVILQFEKASQIHSIDIGNDNSAFVEVLVGHSTSTSSDDYQVILVTSSFMSPMDSKNGINTNRVRMFGPDKLSKSVLDKKWDRAKVVCSQPFNKLTSYGLSFIKFHSPPEKSEESSSASQSEQQSQSASKLGMFRLKEDTKSTSFTAGSFFKQRSITKTEPAPLTGAAAVRAAATLAAASLKTSVSTSQSTLTAGTTTTTTNQVRPSNNSTHKPLDKLSDRPQKVTQKRRLSDEDSVPSHRPGETRVAATRRNTADREEKKTAAPPSKKSRDNDDTLRKKKSSKPFERLMEGVTFVLSGFQNPLRGDLRDKAIEMGAKYKPDWGKGCTHLVCAFANTPKFNQVKSKGKIVTKGWILDSYKKKLLHPWRRYSMVSTSDDSSSYEEESETEDEEDREPKKRSRAPPKKATPNKAMPKTATPKVDTPRDAQPIDKDKEAAGPASSMADQETDPTTAAATASADSVTSNLAAAIDDDCSTTDFESDDGENQKKPKASNLDDISSGGDTEDEVRRIQENKVKAKSSSKDPYDSSTDDEAYSKTPDPPGSSLLSTDIPDLPDFFAGKVFFLYGKFEAEERRQLTRLIVAFEGTMEDYMSEEVTFVVTNSNWDDNFDKALSDHPGLAFVRPKWIYDCCEKSKKVPYQPYVIVPS